MEGTKAFNELFRSRFQGHEMPVDPAVWTGIAGQLPHLPAPSEEGLNELFRDRFADHSVQVDPSVWQGIATQMGHGAAATGAAATGSHGLLLGTGIAAALVIAGLAFWSSNSDTRTEDSTTLVENTVEAPAVLVTDDQPLAPTQEPAPANGPTVLMDDAATAAADTEVPVQPKALVAPAGTKSMADALEEKPTDREVEVPEVLVPKGVATGPHFTDVKRILQQAVVETATHPVTRDPEPIPAISPSPVETENENETGQGTSAPASYTLFIPNVFSPNSDNLNDELRPEGEGLDKFQRVIVRIYSATTDQLVFSANSLAGWDGRDMSGQLCPDGYYFYALEAIGPDGKTLTKGQTVRLFR